MNTDSRVTSSQRIILATHNAHKVIELHAMLDAVAVEILSLRAFPAVQLPPETGDTFAANAALKADAVCAATGAWALADDSGLCVAALADAPGVYSARYAGEPTGDARADDARNNDKLLHALTRVSPEQRGATFVCVLALARPHVATIFFEGRVEGVITTAPRGAHGFGYDPLFFVPSLEKTFAELNAEEKSKISHRGAAVAQLSAWLGMR